MSPPLVLLNNVYSYRNRGDSAIVEAMARWIEKTNPQTRIYLASQFWEENRSYFDGLGWRSVPPLWDIPMDPHKARRLLRSAGALARLAAGRAPGGQGESTAWLYRQASLILDVGGGSLFSSHQYPFYLGLYQHLFNLWAGKQMGRPVMLGPQTIGPFHRGLDRWATCRVLRKLDGVMVRDRASQQWLKSRNIASHLTPDAAFLGGPSAAPAARVQALREQLFSGSLVNIGVTVLDWRWARGQRAALEQALKDYLDKIALALSRLAFEAPIRVAIFPQVTAGFGDSDLALSQELQEKLRPKVRQVVLLDPELDAASLGHLYAGLTAFVGSRMHSTIFAMLQTVPTIGLAYQPKTFGTFELLGLQERVFDVADFSADELYTRLREILEHHEQERQRLRQAVGRLQGDLEQTFGRLIGPYLAMDPGRQTRTHP